MGCFTLGYIEQLLIWLVVICVLFAIVKLLVPMLLAAVGAPPGGTIVMTVLGYILWAVVAIFCIILVFDVLACVIGAPSLHVR